MFKLLSLSSILLFSTGIYSQKHDHSSHLDHSNMRDGENVEYCITHKKLAKLMQDPDLAQEYLSSQHQLELETQLYEQETNLNKAGTVYKIPIVFHVLHNGGNENIDRTQILNAVDVLNTDFRLQNADANNVVSAFQGLPSDVEIEFVLATVAPDGQCFSGITRTQSPRTDDLTTDSYDGGDQIDAVIAGNDVYQGTWSATKYLNVFVCRTIDGAAGYTYNPGFGTSMRYNSIFVLSNYVGSIGTSSTYSSRTLTHEVGHWLNLSHTWGPNNNPGNSGSCNDDDYVSDTPNTLGVTSCNLAESSCGVLANVENYMDYSYCSKMFTPGQRTRMRAALTSTVGGRSNLWKTANLNATGATGVGVMCKADFSSNYTVVCAGSSIDFADASYATPSGWNWTFQGGTPSSSSSQNPTIVYETPGLYAVSLTASNSNGSVAVTRTQYVKVLSETGIAPIQEGFEHTTTIPSNNWFVNNENGITWELTDEVSNLGSNCAMIENSLNTEGDIDELESTTITLELNVSASISFDYAFAKKNASNTDKLLVKVSNNCGQTWNTKKSLSGSVLETAPSTSTSFVPNDSQWKTATISSGSLVNYLNSDFRIKFIFQNGGGNNLYLDNINIDGPVTISGDVNGDGVIGQGEIAGDTNNDGVIGQGEIAGNTNGDGVIGDDEVAGDINGDGVIGQGEITGDTNGDGVINQNEVEGDINGDGVIDYVNVKEGSTIDGFSIHPNPATNKVILSFVTQSKGDNFTIKIFDIIGKKIEDVYSGILMSGEHQFLINTDNYQSGVYLISLNDGVNSRLQKLIIK